MGLLDAIALYGALCKALERGTFYENGREIIEDLASVVRGQIAECIAELANAEPQP